MDTIRMITMSLREISRLKTIQAVAEGDLRAVTAAVQLGLDRSFRSIVISHSAHRDRFLATPESAVTIAESLVTMPEWRRTA